MAAAPPAWQAATGWRRAAGHAADLWRWGGGGSPVASAAPQRSAVEAPRDRDTLPAASAPAQRWRAPLVYDAHGPVRGPDDAGPGRPASPGPTASNRRWRSATSPAWNAA
ncbi:MAG: hypothetical protein IPO15_01635 [Anaerolineae bacterium]|uniref:hypothetical protein n=1 Tax=Candidatus Amarolinea dominans TaxID=3140696 RepID=UPI003135B6C9|nr:hypothetical protein [Anaerolineae bacterium]